MTETPGATAWPVERRALWLRRLMAVGALVMIAATWRLWTPQTVFPQVPLLAAAGLAPQWCDWLLLAVTLAALVVSCAGSVGSRWAPRALTVFAVSISMMMLLDQHRIQPWAYQFALVAIALAWCDASKALRLVGALTISIYAYSAISKFDYAFLHTLGQQFVGALAGSVGQSIQHWSPGAKVAAAWTIPLGELMIALGLCCRPVRRLALVASIVMHVLLIVALGPWGLHHKPGVLLWNGYFIAQNLLVFGPGSLDSALDANPRVSFFSRAATWKFAAAMLLPLSVSWGWWDEWPSWGLYSARAEKVGLFVRRESVDDVPVALRRFLRDTNPDEPWMQLPIDRWSLDALDAPIYPQARFQLGVASAVFAPSQFDRFQIVIASAPERFTGKRQEVRIASAAELAAARAKYWLNSTARMRD